MATVLQQVLDRIDAILVAHVPAGCSVFRDRQDAESRAEAPSVNVTAEGGPVQTWGDADRHESVISLRIYVRSEPGAIECEAVHASFHEALMADAVLTGFGDRRLLECTFERAEADGTAMHKTARYRFIYLIPKTTL